MSTSGMGFSERSKKVILLSSSGKCSNSSCRISMLEDFKLIGKFCHIEGQKETQEPFIDRNFTDYLEFSDGST